MALVTTSNSLRALKFTDNFHCGNSSSALDFAELNWASASTICVGRSEYSVSGKVGKHGFSRRTWPSSSLLARRERRCNVKLNAGSTPESQTTDTEVDSSSSQGPSVQSHLDLLQRLTAESSLGAAGSTKTIAQQLKEIFDWRELRKPRKLPFHWEVAN